MVTLAAEFPNDNPDLHDGVIWVCRDVTGPATPERAARAPVETVVIEEPVESILGEPEPRESGIFVAAAAMDAFDALEEEEPILVEELTPFEAIAVEVIAPRDEEPSPAEPSTTIVPPAPVTEDPWQVFVAAVVEVASARGAAEVASTLPATLEADTTAKAWAGILRGTSEDWDAIGGTMLDEWAADLLARALGAADQTGALKRDLRDRGVAAFGMIEAAAA